MKLLPSLLYPDFAQFSARFAECVAMGGEVHIDFADGEFVPNRLPSIDKVMSLPGEIELEAHLMVQKPTGWIDSALHDNRFKRLLIQPESEVDIAAVAHRVKQAGRKIGLALEPETSVEQVAPYLGVVDQVLVLLVNPGFNGSPFIPEMLEKIKQLRSQYPHLEIEADGGMNPETLALVQAAGADRATIGSYLHEKPLAEGLAELATRFGSEG